MPSIRKLRSGNFQAIVRLKNLKPLHATFPTKTKAKQWAHAVESDTALARKLSSGGDLSLQQAVQVETNKGAIRVLIPRFIEWTDEFISQNEFGDNSIIGRLERWKSRFKDKLVTDVLPEDIDDMLLELSNRGLTGSTLNRYKSNLSSVFIAFNQHPRYKRLKFSNPVRSEFVSSFPENPAKNRFLSPTEQQHLLQHAQHSHWNRLYLLVLMALTTGARRGELLKLTWQDIDFKEKTATLKTTKNGQPRLLPLLNPVIIEMQKFTHHPTHRLFPSTVNPTSAFDFKKAWNNLVKVSRLEGLRFHDLRHTAASNMVASNRTLFETGTLLGHKQASTTMRYAHLAHHHTSQMAEDVWKNLHGQ